MTNLRLENVFPTFACCLFPVPCSLLNVESIYLKSSNLAIAKLNVMVVLNRLFFPD
ncbi:MAG: hypothetical protein F6K18_29350 [Okeania sp. SIO2C2]|uniref:hypothetical protein n=1 Tax=unclassified Okeania TaxID=2634635 RepID=UPI0013BA6D6E|nr:MULTISPECIES: hypothetical protein [unclassified Okeania]NEP44923.1 hypothetical protein [Okeania sp. SIO2H7]NEP74339.1 hypothetical protein [Okeania sp. SIO2G5]NEP90593.1 hypothetical protein [Okeania sp. SIO2C2]NEP95415.1 hypothetical protein [Okeania sp. SIO2F5]NEQ93076.1 hypothetical protein [Okeania sp. SIO2G4]